jgi:TatD DNase family protein
VSVVDSHCHLDDERFAEDRQAVIERAWEAGVEALVCIGTGGGPPDLETGLRLAAGHPNIYCTVGVHPHDVAKASGDTWGPLSALVSEPKVVALGEIGLDYHYDFSPRDIQRAAFIRQLDLAGEAGKPVVIHTREAWEDTADILRRHWSPYGLPGIMHCFTGDAAQAREALNLGFFISFAGVVTFPKAAGVHEAARIVPGDRLLIETDAPYLAPVPHRGRRNEPAFVVEVARKLGELRAESPERIAEVTTANFHRLCLPAGNARK